MRSYRIVRAIPPKRTTGYLRGLAGTKSARIHESVSARATLRRGSA